MKALVVGTGSIGRRHASNLREMGCDVIGVDINAESCQKAASYCTKTFSSLDDGLREEPQIAFICTFSHDHLKSAYQCAEMGCHLFIEKPLSTSLVGIDQLVQLTKARGLVTMVGCNMRFHPAISIIQEILRNNPSFSNPLWADLEFGYFLPFAKENYSASYMARRSLGGNLIFDDIHELDYAVWYLGTPERVLCTRRTLSGLDIDTEDCVDMLVHFVSGAHCRIHMDYLQHGYSRRCKVVSSKGTVCWDFAYGKLGQITIDNPTWSWTELPLEIGYNQMYTDEVRYFLKKCEKEQQTFNTIEHAVIPLKLAVAAETSCSTGLWEKIEEVG